MELHIDGLVQEKQNSIANALELCLLVLTHRYVVHLPVNMCLE